MSFKTSFNRTESREISQALIYFLVVALVCTIAGALLGCSEGGPSAKQELLGPGTFQAAKPVVAANPLQGLDEEGYATAIGSPESMEGYLKIISRRVALAMKNKDVRRRLFEEIQLSADGTVNLAEVAGKNATVLAALSGGFQADLVEKGITGRLAEEMIRGDTDAQAFLKVSKALFGLQVRLALPEGHTWNSSQALPVFHNPITDESVTESFEGYNPDGTEVKFNFGVKQAPYPFLYVHQDEKYFRRAENLPLSSEEGSAGPRAPQEMHTPQGVRLGLFFLLPQLILPDPVYAGQSPHDNCFSERKLVLRGIKIFENFEHNIFSKPEIYSYSQVQYKYPGNAEWKPKNAPLDFVDKPNYAYGPDNEIPVPITIYSHSGETCDNYNYWPHPKEDWAIYRIKEWDPWPNPPDKVAKWINVPSSNDHIHLIYRNSLSTNGWMQKANITVGSVH